MKPDISRAIFWDTEYDNIDWKNKSSYVIERVVTYGNLKDWEAILEYYGKEEIKKTMKAVRTLDNKSLSYLSTYFNLPMESFQCYRSDSCRRYNRPFEANS